MRARGARDGFGWRRRLRGRRARGGPASPAALPDRGERRHRERQGKGLGGLAGPVPCPRDPRPPGTPGDPTRPPSRGETRPWLQRCPLPAWAGRGADPERLACPPHWPGPRGPQVHASPASALGPPAKSSPAVAVLLGQCLQKRGRSRSAQERPGACGSMSGSGGDPVAVFPVNCV